VTKTPASKATAALSETELVRRVAAGDAAAFEALMRQCNRKLFRVARAILKDDAEAEEAVQDVYVTSYRAIGDFRGDSKLATWLTRIVINEALGRLRRRRRDQVVVPISTTCDDRGEPFAAAPDGSGASPEEAALRAELRLLLERKIDGLPMAFRTVFIMRELEEMTVEETAQCLQIPEATVRSRLFRARGLLREALAREIDLTTPDAFAFAGARCDRIVAAVLERVTKRESASHQP
jgi:RNA polymerase sigma-70 factor, ECF subfamily